MILYFSGTGNSAYTAKRVGQEIQDGTLNLFDKIRKQDHSALSSESSWVVVAPTYAWRIPRVVSDWLMKTALEGARDIYFVLTCGGSIGNAGAYLKRLSEARGLRFRGCAGVKMPEKLHCPLRRARQGGGPGNHRPGRAGHQRYCPAHRGGTAPARAGRRF